MKATDGIDTPPMCKLELEDLEREAGRKFVSEEQAQAYRKRKLTNRSIELNLKARGE